MRNTIDHLKATGRVVESVSRFEEHFLAVDIVCQTTAGEVIVQLSARAWLKMNVESSQVRREILSHITKSDVTAYEIPLAERVTFSPFIKDEQEVPADYRAGGVLFKISKLAKQDDANAQEAMKLFDDLADYFELHFADEMGVPGMTGFAAFLADSKFKELSVM